MKLRSILAVSFAVLGMGMSGCTAKVAEKNEQSTEAVNAAVEQDAANEDFPCVDEGNTTASTTNEADISNRVKC
jgi:hypothetical protein